MSRDRLPLAAISFLTMLFCAVAYSQQAIPVSRQLQPAELAAILHSPAAAPPLILQVGSHVLYTEAHIPGAAYAGPAGEKAGRERLRRRVRGLKRDQAIVIYCGCCPWPKCPNIRPAYRLLLAMGFTQVKVLHIAHNFGTDWVSHGYPIAKGH